MEATGFGFTNIFLTMNSLGISRFQRLIFGSGLILVCAVSPLTSLAQSRPEDEPTVKAAARTLPAVVNISTERMVSRRSDPFEDLFFEFYGRGRNPRRQMQTVQSLGSGFIVDPSGYIITNEHVVERAADLKISVTLNNGKTYQAQYITGEVESDLALIKIESKEPLPFIDLNDLSPNLPGQTVLVLGNPVGYGSSIARGILSAKNRSVTVGDVEYRDLIQTDAAINPGNSGGPLVDIAGKLVGVSSVKMAFTPQGVPTQGLGFAVPAELVRTKILEFRGIAKKQDASKASGSVVRRHFGITLQDLTPEVAEGLGLDPAEKGVVIADVEEKSPADHAGLKYGLVIYQVGKYYVTSARQVEALLDDNQISKGSVVDFTVGVTRKIRGQNMRLLQPFSLTAR